MINRAAIALITVALLLASTAGASDFEDALAAYRAGRHADALAGFEKLVAATPEYHYGHFMVGMCKLQLGRHDGAASDDCEHGREAGAAARGDVPLRRLVVDELVEHRSVA